MRTCDITLALIARSSLYRARTEARLVVWVVTYVMGSFSGLGLMVGICVYFQKPETSSVENATQTLVV